MIRPEVIALLIRWQEVLAGLGLTALGLWLARGPGWLLGALGLGLGALGLVLAFVGARRLRFARPVAAPGVVGVLEGQITWMGPETGGAVALSELTEVRLTRDGAGRRAWALHQPDRVLTIPQEAAGAERLFDIFAALPQARTGVFLEALHLPCDPPRVLWRRPGQDARVLRLRPQSDAGPAPP